MKTLALVTLSICAAKVKGDAALNDQYAARALELLKRAQSDGFFKDVADIERLDKDTDFDALRQRDDFRKFLESVNRLPAESR